ncbi:MAG: helix-turn-helix domain-containing protein [Oscillospiraceae bacterium]|nr:helix-turn-helix domain-containing protein [Oscillospiraceae bacterium]
MLLPRLRELRTSNKLTQQEVAERLQLSRDAYSLYELGKRQMNYDTIRLLADMYNVSVDYLLGRYESNPILLSKDETELVDQYRLLDDRGKETVKAGIAFVKSYIDNGEKNGCAATL